MAPHALAHMQRLAAAFREALDLAHEAGEDRIAWLGRFPRDCCDFASVLLFLFLYEHGVRGLRQVTAVRRGSEDDPFSPRHVWLQVGEVIIDITADQFEGVGERVVVAVESPFHASLQIAIQAASPAAWEDEAETYERIADDPSFVAWYAVLRDYVEPAWLPAAPDA